MVMQRDPSIAARVLDVIERAPAWINTSEIYEQIDEAENIAIVSVSCRDLVESGRVTRQMRGGRWCYRAAQAHLFGEPVEANELANTLDQPASAAPARQLVAHKVGGHAAGVPKLLKLRTLDRLAEIVADDIAHVLRAIRSDVERAA